MFLIGRPNSWHKPVARGLILKHQYLICMEFGMHLNGGCSYDHIYTRGTKHLHIGLIVGGAEVRMVYADAMPSILLYTIKMCNLFNRAAYAQLHACDARWFEYVGDHIALKSSHETHMATDDPYRS